MVDFNNESTITRTPKDILEVLIIEKRTYFIDAFEKYNKDKSNNIKASIAVIKSRLFSLFLEIRPSLSTHLKTKEFEKLKKLLESKESKDLLAAFDIISDFLYSKKLIMWDSMKQYDPSSAEEENKFHGMG